MSHSSTSNNRAVFGVVLISIFFATACYSKPKIGLLFSKYSIKTFPIPTKGYFKFYYKTTNPNIIFISEGTVMGPGIMYDIASDRQEYIENPFPHPEQSYKPPIPGETREAWLKRRAPPPPIVDETFVAFSSMDNVSPLSDSRGYTTTYQGRFVEKSGIAPKGFPFPTGLRKTEEYFFTGDLIITVSGEVVIKQHLENIPSFPLRSRAYEALEVGLILYKDEHPDGSGTLHLLRMKPWKGQQEGESNRSGGVQGIVGPIRPQ